MKPELRVAGTPAGPLEYAAAGNGPVLLAFHGAIGNAESMEWFVRAFAPRFRVIVPSLGDSRDLDRFCAGVEAVLERENATRVTAFGISFGGLLAQGFVRRHPARVERLILMSCGAPRLASALLFGAASFAAGHLPSPVVRWLTSRFLSRRLVHAPGARGGVRRALDVHLRRLAAAATSVRRELVAARFRIAADVHRAADDIRLALDSWTGPILLLIASDDPLFPPRAQRRLSTGFPRVQVHTFARGGHLIPLFHGDEMRRIVTRFAEGVSGSEPASLQAAAGSSRHFQPATP